MQMLAVDFNLALADEQKAEPCRFKGVAQFVVLESRNQ